MGDVPGVAGVPLTPCRRADRSGTPGSFSRLVGVEARVEDLGDPLLAFFEVGAGRVVEVQALALEGLLDAFVDLPQVQTGKAPGIGGDLAAGAEGDVGEHPVVG